MAAKRTQYQIVGRYLCGVEVTGYHLQSMDTGKAGKYTREQVCYLVGRDQVTNCTGQIYQDKVLLRGKGMSLEDLPAVNEKGNMKNTEAVGKVRKDTTAAQAMEQFMIVGTIKRGKTTEGYTLQNAGGATKRGSRAQVLELAKQGKIGNARVQMYQGKPLLRGVGCNLNDLPCEQLEGADSSKGSTANTKSTTNDKSEEQDKHVKVFLKLIEDLNDVTEFDINKQLGCKQTSKGKVWYIEEDTSLAKYKAAVRLVLTYNKEVNFFIESNDPAENTGGAGNNYRRQFASYGSGKPITSTEQYNKVVDDIFSLISLVVNKLSRGESGYTDIKEVNNKKAKHAAEQAKKYAELKSKFKQVVQAINERLGLHFGGVKEYKVELRGTMGYLSGDTKSWRQLGVNLRAVTDSNSSFAIQAMPMFTNPLDGKLWLGNHGIEQVTGLAIPIDAYEGAELAKQIDYICNCILQYKEKIQSAETQHDVNGICADGILLKQYAKAIRLVNSRTGLNFSATKPTIKLERHGNRCFKSVDSESWKEFDINVVAIVDSSNSIAFRAMHNSFDPIDVPIGCNYHDYNRQINSFGIHLMGLEQGEEAKMVAELNQACDRIIEFRNKLASGEERLVQPRGIG